MSLFKNIFFAVVLGVVAWFLYIQFAGPNAVVPPEGEASLPFTHEATTTTYHVTIDLPTTPNAVLNDSVRAYADARIAEFDEMYGPAAFSAEDLDMLGFTTRDMRYEQFISGEVWSSGTLDGMIVQEYNFTGGAHGGTSLAPFMYDDAGNELRLKDLFVDGAPYLERIAQAVVPRLKTDLETNQIFNQEMFEAGTKADEGNYMVFSLATASGGVPPTAGDDSSITFYFNQYQVAPYAAGILEVTVPLSDFSDILSPNYF
ncbi:MAG: hypothetical protein QG633_571 [Patescibacteria group bacterium]|jgi:hypothetical protein|nr:hypothetical protein [Patescibacteria group bacterium]